MAENPAVVCEESWVEALDFSVADAIDFLAAAARFVRQATLFYQEKMNRSGDRKG